LEQCGMRIIKPVPVYKAVVLETVCLKKSDAAGVGETVSARFAAVETDVGKSAFKLTI